MEKYSTVVGIDLGDKKSLYKALSASTDEELQSGSIQTTKAGLSRAFGGWEPSLFVIEQSQNEVDLTRVLFPYHEVQSVGEEQ